MKKIDYSPRRMPSIKKKKKKEREREKIASIGEGVGVIATLCTVDRNVKWCSYCRKCYGYFQKRKQNYMAKPIQYCKVKK